MEQRQIFRRSRVIVAAFALLFLIAVSSSVILLSDDELSAEEIDGINYTLNEGYDLSVPVIRMNGTEIITLGGVRSTTIVLLNIIEDAEITVSGIVVNIYTVTVTSEGNMTFTYVIDDNDPVGFTAGPGGSYSISVSHGSVLVIQAMPGEGHQFKWTNTGAGTSDGNVLTINVTADGTVGGSPKDSLSELITYILFFVVAVAILLLLMFGRARLYP